MLNFVIKNDETIFSGTNGNFNIDFTPYKIPSPTGRYKLTLENVIISSPSLFKLRYITSDLLGSDTVSNIDGAFNILCSILLNDDGMYVQGSLNTVKKYEINNFNRIVNFKIYKDDGTIDNSATCILEFSIKEIKK